MSVYHSKEQIRKNYERTSQLWPSYTYTATRTQKACRDITEVIIYFNKSSLGVEPTRTIPLIPTEPLLARRSGPYIYEQGARQSVRSGPSSFLDLFEINRLGPSTIMGRANEIENEGVNVGVLEHETCVC